MSSILVVEGEGSISRLLNEELANEEYRTIGVLNGDDAVQFALREVPLLIIFNLTFSIGDVYEAIRRLHSHPKSMHIPIIVLSSSLSPPRRATLHDPSRAGAAAGTAPCRMTALPRSAPACLPR